MKIGIGLRIDVTKIDKARIFEGKKGKYIDLSTFVDLNSKDEYGNNGFIAHSVTKEEREKGIKGEIVGNTKVFYSDQQQQSYAQSQQSAADDFEDKIPF